MIKNLAPEALSDEGLPRKKKLVEAIGQSKATQEDKDAKEKAKKSNNKQQKINEAGELKSRVAQVPLLAHVSPCCSSAGYIFCISRSFYISRSGPNVCFP